ncbi:MAG: alpha/beta fold hydrolase [Acidimicrobiales bacterium]
MSSTIVLVHGAWHGAWCWDRVAGPLRDQGHEVIAVDLPGHGADEGPLVDLHGDAAAVRSVLDEVGDRADGDRDEGVVLVGHSYGGAVITEAGAHPAVRRLVYIAAFCIDDTEGCASALADDPEARVISHGGRPNLAHAFVLDDQGVSTLTPDGAAACLYNDCDQAGIDWALERIGPHPLLNLTQPPDAVAWRDRPSTYVVCEHDMGVHPDLQRLLARRCDDVVSWPLDHSPFLSDPDRVADLLGRLADA